MKTSVRKATADDYNALCDLFDEVDALHRDNLPHRFQQPSGPARERDDYLRLITDDDVALLVGAVGGSTVGFVHAMIREPPGMPMFVRRRYAVIENLVVKSEFRKQGIGRILVDEVQEWAIAKGARSIELNVYEFNETAISFYEGLGYRNLSRKMSKELKKAKPG
ncbi:MAG: GNAT family N-acetyltransferase [Anaerolineales bacterium]